MKSLIIGNGQVGSSLYKVVSPHHETLVKDVDDLEADGIEILHLCFPFSEEFVEIANKYIEKYKPKVTVNHASVELGTTEKLKGLVCYSPIRGKHPNLDKGIKVFDKFIAGPKEATDIIDKYFRDANVKTIVYDEGYIKTLEFCKLMSNIRYGYEICFMQEAERIAGKYKINLDTFKMFEESYNEGYKELGEDYMVRPILFGGIIGGHCVIQNMDILSKQCPSEMFDWMYFSHNKRKAGF